MSKKAQKIHELHTLRYQDTLRYAELYRQYVDLLAEYNELKAANVELQTKLTRISIDG